MNYRAFLKRDFNPCWNSLGDNASLKAAVINRLAIMLGYDGSSEDELKQFVEDFNGRGKVSVEDSQIIVQFSDLDVLGIALDSDASPADLDHMFREKLTALADSKTAADKIRALNKIIGTEINGISTAPNHSQHHWS